MFSEVDDNLRPFIEEKMREIDEKVYNSEEFERFFNLPHTILTYQEEGKVIAFCTLLEGQNYNQLCYTWCENTKAGRKAYALGSDYVIANYSPLGLGEGAREFNKIKRIIND